MTQLYINSPTFGDMIELFSPDRESPEGKHFVDDPETVYLWSIHSLPEGEMKEIALHLAECEHCQSEIVAMLQCSALQPEIEAGVKENNSRAILALKSYDYRLQKYIGAYSAVLGGVDVLVFTGGVGENQWTTRSAVCKDMEYMGIELDEELNKSVRAKEVVISKPTSKVKVVIIPTDEELTIAKDTVEMLGKQNSYAELCSFQETFGLKQQ